MLRIGIKKNTIANVGSPKSLNRGIKTKQSKYERNEATNREPYFRIDGTLMYGANSQLVQHYEENQPQKIGKPAYPLRKDEHDKWINRFHRVMGATMPNLSKLGDTMKNCKNEMNSSPAKNSC